MAGAAHDRGADYTFRRIAFLRARRAGPIVGTALPAARATIAAMTTARDTSPGAGGRLRWRSASLLALAPFFWACNWIIGRAFYEDLPPMAITLFRWLVAVAILVPFAWHHVRRDWPVLRAHAGIVLALGAIGIAGQNALAYLGLNFTTVTNGVILNSFTPVMIVALAWTTGERLSRLQLAGMAVSLAGVLAILSQGSLAALAAFEFNAGDLVIIVSMAMWAVYTILLRRRPAGVHPLGLLLVLSAVGALVMLPFWGIEAALGRRVVWSARAIAAIASIGLFSSVLAYVFWNRGVEELGPSVAGLFVHLMPVFGVALAWVLLGERPGRHHAVGVALILSGIALATRGGARAGARGPGSVR